MKAMLATAKALILAAGIVFASRCVAMEARTEPVDRCQAVLAMQPLGYWPADEGTGEILHDRSGKENHGKIFHTPWEGGMLNFTSGFQWAEIPGQETYRCKAFTIGGWLFSRRGPYRRNGMLFVGMANPIRLWVSPSIILRIRQGSEIEVVSNGNADAIGSKADKDTIAVNEWQHVIYTYEAGTGRLYLNGQLVQSRDNVPFEGRKHPLLIGSDADWWMLHPPGSNSLDGSVRDLVLFDRALKPKEVARLSKATRPEARPRVLGADAIVIDGREIPPAKLPAVPAEDRRRALAQLAKRDVQAVRSMSATLLPTLIDALDEWQTRGVAARLLMKLGSNEARAALREALPRLAKTLQTEDAPREERAASALALAEMKGQAKDAVPALVAVLEGILERDGVRLPRVEDVLRNALIRALLDIDPKDERARAVLGLALAKPIFESLDLSKPYLAKVRPLVAEGRYMDALGVYSALRPVTHGCRFFSQGDPHRDARGNVHDRSYTPVADHGGFTYTLGAGKSYMGVEPVSREDFEKAVKELSAEHPDAKTWREADAPHLYRVKIIKTDADGNEQTSHLEGENFVFDGSDAKLRGWSLAIDNDGYIHIVGGQHNAPNPKAYIPGSWEKIGLSRDRGSDDFPNQLYWVSTRPGDIELFEFVGRRNNPRQIPSPGYLNYMNFVQDNNGELFLYGRINVSGWQSWGLYRYDTEARRWTALGGDACDVIASAKKNDPNWVKYLIRQIRGSTPSAPGAKSLVWAWQPHFYNYCRANRWGVHFDRTNRMHARVPIRGLGANARIVDSNVYAWSDDDGKTFHRADGTKVALPLTVNPAPDHLADVNAHSTQAHWKLWLSLLRHAGY